MRALKGSIPLKETPSTLKNPFRKFIKYWIPVIIYAIIIFHLSSIPGKAIPQLFRHQDAVIHTVEYAVLAWLFERALRQYLARSSYQKRFLWVLAACIAYALSDEMHQLFVPGRLASFSDIIFDVTGTLIALIITYGKDKTIQGSCL